jgi:Concanavalin A-like lectin/glucanases superfamily
VFGSPPGPADVLNFGIAMNPDWAVPGYVGVMRTDAQLVLHWSETPLLRPSHLVLVHEAGLTLLYLDGEVIASMPQGGDLSDWNPNYDLMFGNYTYYDVRNWRGTFHLVAIYCEALDAARVVTNFEAGHRPT